MFGALARGTRLAPRRAQGMDSTLRGSFPTVQGIGIAAAAFFAAWMVNHLNEVWLDPMPSEGEPQMPLHRQQVTPTPNLDGMRIGRLLGMPEHGSSDREKKFEVRLEIAKSALRLRLLGTLSSAIPEWTFASILDLQSQTSHTYRVGDAVRGAEIVDIERDRVLLVNEGKREFIDRDPGSVGPVVSSLPSSSNELQSKSTQSDQLGAGIRAVSQNEYEVPRSELDNILSNLTSILGDARVLPSVSGDRVDGMKLYSIRPSSVYSRLGLQNGDVVERINGSELNNIETGLALFALLRESSRIDVDIRRNGSTFRRMYRIR